MTDYRTTDPWTSQQPFNKPKLKAVALDAIASHPGSNAGEIGILTGVDGIWKRLPELERLGLIVRGEETFFHGTGRYQSSWYIKEHQLGLLGIANHP